MTETGIIERYSQRDEQEYILASVGQLRTDAAHPPGSFRFLDIGACHPTCFSNTRALYELGWKGVMIEPSPGPFQSLLLEYGNSPSVELVQAAVSFDHGLAELHCTDDMTSTIDSEHYHRWRKICAFHSKFHVPTITLADIFNRFGGDFAFVNIDAEGISGRLGIALLETEARPHCLCIEHDGLSREDGAGRLDKLAKAKGYRLVAHNGENAIYSL